MTGAQLIFANQTEKDIILREMWQSMANVDETFVVSKEENTGLRTGMIDKAMLKDLVSDLDQPFYICGPGPMVDSVRNDLKELGVAEERIITEDGW